MSRPKEDIPESDVRVPTPPPAGGVGDRAIPIDLITLTAVGAWVVLFVGFSSDFVYPFKLISRWLFGLSFLPALYLSTLALRACYLSGARVRRAWRNLILMGVLSVAGVVLVGLTAEHHKRFWQERLPSLAKEMRE